jgi:hypothetical protein
MFLLILLTFFPDHSVIPEHPKFSGTSLRPTKHQRFQIEICRDDYHPLQSAVIKVLANAAAAAKKRWAGQQQLEKMGTPHQTTHTHTGVPLRLQTTIVWQSIATSNYCIDCHYIILKHIWQGYA